MLVPVLALAQDVILLKTEERIDDIRITSISDSTIVYISNDTEHTISTLDVSAYLRNGNYVEITVKQSNLTDNQIPDNTYEPSQKDSYANTYQEPLVDIDESTKAQFKQDLNKYLNGDKAHYALYKVATASIKRLKKSGMYERTYAQAMNTYKEVRDATGNSDEAIETYFLTFNGQFTETNTIGASDGNVSNTDINYNSGENGNPSVKTNVFGYEGYQSNDVKLGIKFKWDASIYLLKGNIDRVKEYDQVRKESNSTGYDNGALQEGLRVYSEMKQAKASSIECIDAYINAYISTFRNQQPMNGTSKSDNW